MYLRMHQATHFLDRSPAHQDGRLAAGTLTTLIIGSPTRQDVMVDVCQAGRGGVTMHDLVYQINCIVMRSHEGAYATQHERQAILRQAGRQLVELGYRQLRVDDLERRHTNALVRLWGTQEIAEATMANRLACLRWLSQKLGKPWIMAKSNAAYGLSPRPQVATVSRARTLDPEKWRQIPDPFVRMSLELQREFGLRAEESMKIKPVQADRGAEVALLGSWCKGGRDRQVTILYDSQRETLDRAKALAQTNRRGSLIPAELTYTQQKNRYYHQCRRVGLSKNHGLRHQYAQRRYLDLTGFPCALAGGPLREDRTPIQQGMDGHARATITEELGHWRLAEVARYIGA